MTIRIPTPFRKIFARERETKKNRKTMSVWNLSKVLLKIEIEKIDKLCRNKLGANVKLGTEVFPKEL